MLESYFNVKFKFETRKKNLNVHYSVQLNPSRSQILHVWNKYKSKSLKKAFAGTSTMHPEFPLGYGIVFMME